jgi:thiol-disulfide isomerase/thioredoxin
MDGGHRRIGHGRISNAMIIHRRTALAAAAGTLAVAALPRKPSAQSLQRFLDANRLRTVRNAQGLSALKDDLEPVSPPQDPPDISFTAADGSTHRLDEFKGRGMVVNMWATWCAPCVAEMPSLDALSKALAPQDIAVLPLSSDRGGAEIVQRWYQQHGITGLPVLLDPKGAMARAFNARGIPTTVIINTGGKVVARLEGAADWASPDAEALIRRLTG